MSLIARFSSASKKARVPAVDQRLHPDAGEHHGQQQRGEAPRLEPGGAGPVVADEPEKYGGSPFRVCVRRALVHRRSPSPARAGAAGRDIATGSWRRRGGSGLRPRRERQVWRGPTLRGRGAPRACCPASCSRVDREPPAQRGRLGLDLGLDGAVAGFAVLCQSVEHLRDHAADVAELGHAEAARGAGRRAEADA